MALQCAWCRSRSVFSRRYRRSNLCQATVGHPSRKHVKNTRSLLEQETRQSQRRSPNWTSEVDKTRHSSQTSKNFWSPDTHLTRNTESWQAHLSYCLWFEESLGCHAYTLSAANLHWKLMINQTFNKNCTDLIQISKETIVIQTYRWTRFCHFLMYSIIIFCNYITRWLRDNNVSLWIIPYRMYDSCFLAI